MGSASADVKPLERDLEPASKDAGAAQPGDASTAGRATQSGKTQNRNAKRKKASRACYHCQKAHLTCDDSRPCQRCIRKGLADQCVDGFRKKAKYLIEEDELASRSLSPALAGDVAPQSDLYARAAPSETAGIPQGGFAPVTSVFDTDALTSG